MEASQSPLSADPKLARRVHDQGVHLTAGQALLLCKGPTVPTVEVAQTVLRVQPDAPSAIGADTPIGSESLARIGTLTPPAQSASPLG